MDYIIEMCGITKEFPGIIANDDVTLQLKKGEIHALLGESAHGAPCKGKHYKKLFHVD